MCLQVSFGDEALTTILEVAVEGSVSRMRPHVCLKVSRFVELLDAVTKRAEQKLIRGTGASEYFIESFYQADFVVV